MKSKFLTNLLRNKLAVIVIALVLVVLYFGITTTGFLSLSNLNSVMLAMSLTGMIAVGISMLLISGEIDLAAGYEACMGGIFLVLMIQAGIPWPLALVLTVVAGGIMGAILAFLVNKVGLFGFISSMALMNIYRGLALILTKGQNIPIDAKYASIYTLGSGSVAGIPVPFIIMLALMLIYGLIMYGTEFGRAIYMCGGNRVAARLCGVNRKKMTTILYINNGAICALAGALVAARMHNASPLACTTGAIDAITAAVLGGVAFRGGAGNMGGCLIGLALITFFNSGLTAASAPPYWQIVIQGALLVIALCLDFFNERSRQAQLEANP